MSSNENDFQAMKVIERIDERLNIIQNFRIYLININKIEDYRIKKNEIIKNFFELEDELRQCSYTLKTNVYDKKNIAEQIRSTNLIYKQNEIKSINYDKDLRDMNIKIQELLFINRILKEKADKDEIEIRQLKETIKLYEDRIKTKQLELDNLEITNKLNNYNYGADLKISKIQIQPTNKNDKDIINNAITEFLTSNQKKNLHRYSPKTNDKLKYESDMVLQSTITNNYVEGSLKRENKIDKLVGLLVKIKNSLELKNYCIEKLSKDFMQKLLSEKVSDGYLEKVECVIDEYYKLFKFSDKNFSDRKTDSNNRYHKNNGNSSISSNQKELKSNYSSSNLKFSSSEFEDNLKSNRGLKSSLSFSKLKNESFKSKAIDNNKDKKSRNVKINKQNDLKETASWASLKDYFCFHDEARKHEKVKANK